METDNLPRAIRGLASRMVTLKAFRIVPDLPPYVTYEILRTGSTEWEQVGGEPKLYVLAQALLPLTDGDHAEKVAVLTVPGDENSETVAVEGVIFCPQGAVCRIQAMSVDVAAEPVEIPVPTEEEAWAFLAKFVKQKDWLEE